MVAVEISQRQRLGRAAKRNVGSLLKRAVVVPDQNGDARGGCNSKVWSSVPAEIGGYNLAEVVRYGLVHGPGILSAAQSFVKRECMVIDGDEVKNAVIVEVGGDDRVAGYISGWNRGCGENNLS